MTAPTRPYIGITTSLEDGKQQLSPDYVHAVEAAGGIPLIVPIPANDATLDAVAAVLSGLIITGGPALAAGLHGTLPDDLDPPSPERLRADRAILRAVRRDRKPVLGICYGMQLLNAEAGGTIYGDVESQVEGTLVHSQKRGATTHPVSFLEGTHLYRLLGADPVTVNTRHLQALCSLGTDFRIAGQAPDGVIEAIETADGDLIGVQFHPERMGAAMHPLFRHLVRRAASHHHPVTTPRTAPAAHAAAVPNEMS